MKPRQAKKFDFIGIIAPDISDLFRQIAKQYLSDLIENKTFDLQTDNISKDIDRFQRLLRSIILYGVDTNKNVIIWICFRLSLIQNQQINRLRTGST